MELYVFSQLCVVDCVLLVVVLDVYSWILENTERVGPQWPDLDVGQETWVAQGKIVVLIFEVVSALLAAVICIDVVEKVDSLHGQVDQ